MGYPVGRHRECGLSLRAVSLRMSRLPEPLDEPIGVASDRRARRAVYAARTRFTVSYTPQVGLPSKGVPLFLCCLSTDSPSFSPSLHFQGRQDHWATVEDAISELMRHHGLRRLRYRGQLKGQLQLAFIGAAANLKRLAATLGG